MATREDVQKLASLSRLKMTDAELDAFTREFDAILAYVGQLEKLELPTDLKGELPPLHNVFRKDENPNESGTYTEKVAAQFPQRSGDYLSVKQIISHD